MLFGAFFGEVTTAKRIDQLVNPERLKSLSCSSLKALPGKQERLAVRFTELERLPKAVADIDEC